MDKSGLVAEVPRVQNVDKDCPGSNVMVMAPVWCITRMDIPGAAWEAEQCSCKAVDFGRFIVAEIMFLSVILSCF